MDKKLQELIAQGNEAEARVRLEKLLGKRDDLATENYVRFCIAEAQRFGFDLLHGDIALVHPEDLPRTVILVARRDPVYAIAHPEVIKGKMLFVRKRLAEQYLAGSQVRH